ncbi:MAG: translation initiation factor IF-2 N-terminal domain-containing protein, partial [Pirellulales bacterium]
MAVRIYALAKELKLDSKDLVDICTKAGVPGKGSALASLTEDEAEKVKQFLKGGGSAKPKPSKAAPPMPQRPAEPPRAGKMPVIVTAKPSPTSRPKSAEPVDEPSVADSPLAATATATETAVAVETSRRPGPLAGAMGREKYIGPGAATGKVPVVGRETKPADRKKGDGPATAERARPAVKLAPLPKTSRRIEQPSVGELPAQKPDLRLPADILGAGKQGAKPLAAHLRRHERTLEEEKKQRGLKGPRVPAGPVPDEEAERRAGKGRHRRGKETVADEADGDRPMLGGREQRQLARRRHAQTTETEDRPQRSLARRQRRATTGTSTAAPRKERVTVQLPCTVRELSEAAGVQASEILRILINEGVIANMMAIMDPEMTELVAAELGINVEFTQAVSLEDQMLADLEQQEDDPTQLVERPPVITFLGHVDHGKTSLLDRIIGIDVVSGESGGITQHIRAYTIEKG